MKMADNPMQHGKLCTDRCPNITNRFFQFDCKFISYIVNAGHDRRLLVMSSNNTMSKYRTPLGNQLRDHTDTKKIKNQIKDTVPAQGDLLRDLPEWLEDFTENLEDE